MKKKFAESKNLRIFAIPKQKNGSIAQLVQSVCLTSRGSGVRLPLLPLKRSRFFVAFFRCSSSTNIRLNVKWLNVKSRLICIS